MTEEQDRKHKFALYIRDSSLDVARQWYEQDNCGSISEFIEKAILFYGGYVASQKNQNYLPNIMVSTLKNMIRESDNRQSRAMYKMAVEISMLTQLLATLRGIDEVSMEKLRGKSNDHVRRSNGALSLEEAVEWQS